MFAILIAAISTIQTPPGGVSVVQGESILAPLVSAYGKAEVVDVTGKPFTKALRVTTTRVPSNDYDFEVGTDAIVPVAKGDVLLATFWIRAIKGQPETGEAQTILDFQVIGGDWSKSVSQNIAATKEWRRIDVPFVVGYSTNARAANVEFRLGMGIQTVEIGGLQITDFGTSRALSDLPRTKIRYEGEEQNAAWRRAALARIEKIRKGPLTIKVVDSRGIPVSGVAVSLEMTRHAFPFGTAVAADELFETGSDADHFRSTLLADFNRATIENHLKWPMWAQAWGRRDALRAVDWIDAHGLTLRAHNAVWPSWRNSPDGLSSLSVEQLRNRVDEHIDDIVSAVKGKVDLWDVVNEPHDNHDILDLLGPQTMKGWYRRVKAIDPKPRLFLNDYPPLDGGATTNSHLNSFYKTLADLKASGAPIEGIGFQCHVGGEAIPPIRILGGLDRFAKLGLPIEITEFDINTQDREYQANYMRDFLIAVFSHPAVTGFTQWGFWAKRHWLPESALYDENWHLRPHGKVFLDLTQKTWWTHAAGRTSRLGAFATNGYFGDYLATVTIAGKILRTVKIHFVKRGTTVSVRI